MVQVELAVYDLSNGMASQLSEAILGQRIDGIWHTGVVVYGREYFFGGGIQNLPIGSFTTSNGLRPCQMLSLGQTDKTQAELETYLRSINHQYTQATYDLINHNCNNFSNTVAMFLVNSGIPTHIVDLPRIVFSTPGGMMLRPMIESMQSGISQSGAGMDPFGAGAGAGGGGHPLAQLSNTNYSASTASSTASIVTPPPSVQITASVRTFTPTPAEKAFVSAEIDPKTLQVLCNKILNYRPPPSGDSDSGEEVLSAEESAELSSTIQALGSATLLVFPHRSFVMLGRLVQSVPPLQMACLFILRLLALQVHLLPRPAPPSDCSAYTSCQLAVQSLLSLVQRGSGSSSDSGSTFSSPSALVMALCTLANLVSSPAGCDLLFQDTASSDTTASEGRVSACVDACAWGLSHTKPEVRQMAATLAYNLALASTRGGGQTVMITQEITSLPWRGLHAAQEEKQQEGGEEELHQHIVQLLCAVLETVGDETDAVSLGRKLHAAYFVCVAGGALASELVSALGFDHHLGSVREKHHLLTQADKARLGNLELLLHGP